MKAARSAEECLRDGVKVNWLRRVAEERLIPLPGVIDGAGFFRLHGLQQRVICASASFARV